MEEPARVRARVYFDGFNFYYGAFVKDDGTPSELAPYKWLDLRKFCENVLPAGFDIDLVRYFTTPSRNQPGSSPGIRQQTYLSALEAYCGVEVNADSHFKRRTKMRDVADRNEHCQPSVKVSYSEEKGADVNLATWLLIDCFRDLFDVAVVVSDDTDLRGAIKAVSSEFGKSVVVINVRKRSSTYDGVVEVFKAHRPGYFKNNQLPQVIELPKAKLYCPVEWRTEES